MLALRKQASSECTALQRFSGSARLGTISRIFIESALLYTLAVGISVVMELVNNDAFYVTTDVVSANIYQSVLCSPCCPISDCRIRRDRVRSHHHTHLDRKLVRPKQQCSLWRRDTPKGLTDTDADPLRLLGQGSLLPSPAWCPCKLLYVRPYERVH